MYINEALVSSISQSRKFHTIYRTSRKDWYLKIDDFGTEKFYRDGRKHTINFLTLDDYVACDWEVYL